MIDEEWAMNKIYVDLLETKLLDAAVSDRHRERMRAL